MSTPRYTAEGVKVDHIGGLWYCGHCGNFIADTHGFSATTCSRCGINNRPDFSPDIPSERIRQIARELTDGQVKLASVGLSSIYAKYAVIDLLNLVEEVEYLEKIERDTFDAVGLRHAVEPVEPPPPYRGSLEENG